MQNTIGLADFMGKLMLQKIRSVRMSETNIILLPQGNRTGTLFGVLYNNEITMRQSEVLILDLYCYISRLIYHFVQRNACPFQPVLASVEA